VTSRQRGGWRATVLGVATLVAGCAPEATPLLREDFDRLRADLLRLEQEVQGSRSAVVSEIQASDRRAAQALTDLQRSVARLGARLDDLGREAGQLQGRVDELRRRVDALALQFDVATPPAPAAGGGSRGGTTPPPTTAQQRPALPGSQASDLYQTAYIDFTRGNYNLAIAAFREYIRLYPQTDLAEKAQYWIGESHFSLARAHQARGERDRAIQELERAVQEFRKLVVTYPRGDRVPTALYKEALALIELGQLQLAEARLQFLVDQFPSTEEAAKAREDLGRLRKR
jgi:tol-pal system protein YbgF